MSNRARIRAAIALGSAVVVIGLMGVIYTAHQPHHFNAESRDAGDREPTLKPAAEPVLFVQEPASRKATKSVSTIRFYDGETAEVHFRSMPGNDILYPTRLSDKLEEWKEAARGGDADVARILYKSLNNCRGNIYESYQEYAATIDQFQQTHVIQRNVDSYTVPMEMEPTSDMLAELQREYEFCKRVTEQDLQSADEFQKLAADGGNILAQLALGQKLLANPEGRTYLEMAWLSGSINAAGWLANSLTINSNEMSADLIAAYAYKALSAELVRADFEARGLSEHPSSKAWMDAGTKGAARLARRLRPHELRRAQEMMKELYAANKNCCISR